MASSARKRITLSWSPAFFGARPFSSAIRRVRAPCPRSSERSSGGPRRTREPPWPLATNVPDQATAPLPRLESRQHPLADPPRPGRDTIALERSDPRKAAAQATGLPPRVPPGPPTCGTASLPGERQGVREGLRGRQETRPGPAASTANIRAVRQNPIRISSVLRTLPKLSAISLRPSRKAGGCATKPPSPWTGSMMLAVTRSGPGFLRQGATEVRQGPPNGLLLAGEVRMVEVAGGVAVDLRRVRAEPVLAGGHHGRQGHSEERTAVERPAERDHRLLRRRPNAAGGGGAGQSAAPYGLWHKPTRRCQA